MPMTTNRPAWGVERIASFFARLAATRHRLFGTDRLKVSFPDPAAPPSPLLTEIDPDVLPGVSAVARYWDAARSPVGRCRRCQVCRVDPYYRDPSYLICLVGEPAATAGA